MTNRAAHPGRLRSIPLLQRRQATLRRYRCARKLHDL